MTTSKSPKAVAFKRRQEAHVRGVTYWSQCRDLRLKVLTHNIMILVIVEVFYRAVLTLYLSQAYFLVNALNSTGKEGVADATE